MQQMATSEAACPVPNEAVVDSLHSISPSIFQQTSSIFSHLPNENANVLILLWQELLISCHVNTPLPVWATKNISGIRRSAGQLILANRYQENVNETFPFSLC